jgi:23S rRNA (cytidine1920-2'-O)/16S rRNA (cytidine1409-2'-O)-methyltransferase
MVERRLADSRAQAQRLAMAGQVRVDGQVVIKPAAQVATDALIEIDHGPPFVSRGGEKLEAALATFYLDVHGLICADVGASTGGFTDCLLQNGAARVYSIDVGHGILHWKLRQDPRVVVMERTNARHVERLPEPVDLVTIDASFISLKVLLPVVKNWLVPSPPSSLPSPGRGWAGGEGEMPAGGEAGKAGAFPGQVIALVKPQFEAGRSEVARGGGVIRDPAIHRRVLDEVLTFAQAQGYSLQGLIRSPLLGPKGNTEFLAWLSYPAGEGKSLADLLEHLYAGQEHD